jgi:hypothetical protein
MLLTPMPGLGGLHSPMAVLKPMISRQGEVFSRSL